MDADTATAVAVPDAEHAVDVTFINTMQYGVKLMWKNPATGEQCADQNLHADHNLRAAFFQDVGTMHGACAPGYARLCRMKQKTFVGHEFAITWNAPCEVLCRQSRIAVH